MATAMVNEGLATNRDEVLRALHLADLDGLVKMVNVGVYCITYKGQLQRASDE